MEVKSKAFQGAAVVLLEQGWTKIIGVIGTIILSRLLFPRDFGLIATASIAVNFFSVFISKGISSTLIQKKELDHALLATCSCVCGALGVFFALFLFLIAPLIAGILHIPILKGLLCILSPVLFLRSLSAVPAAIIQKRLDFVRGAIPTVVGGSVYWCVAVFFAWLGSGVWSFVWATLASAFIFMVLNWVMSSLKPRFYFSKEKFKALLGFGVPVLLIEVVEYSAAHVDYFIIAKFLGPVALGFYFLAYQFSNFFYSKISISLTKVFFPVFCNLKSPECTRRYYLKVAFYLGMIIFPFYVAACLLNEEVVLVVYGAKWAQAALPLGILSIFGIAKGLCVGGGNRDILYAQGRPDTFLKLRIMAAVLNAAAVLLGLAYGIVGIAVAVTLTGIVSSICMVIVVNRLMDVSWQEYAVNLAPPVVASIIMGGVILLLKPWLFVGIGSLIITIILGVVAYIAGLYLMGVYVWREMRSKLALLSYNNV